MTPHSYAFTRKTIGRLSCGVVHPTDEQLPIGSVAVFCHGFGASGDDLVGLAEEILHLATLQMGTVMVFPEAPLDLDEQGIPGGRAWWMLSIQRLIDAMEQGHYELIKDSVPDGIDMARDHLVETVQLVLESVGLGPDRLLLGGFSQGAMLVVDTSLRGLPAPPAALSIYSGCLICQRIWQPLAAKLRDTAIVQSHGTQDPILPFQTARWLYDLLVEAGCTVNFIQFSGGHTIPWEAVESTAKNLTDLTNAPRSHAAN
ncbi:MAG: lysophospholipase [Pirellulaceae bacterium]|nr:MAG: lysophospholipase [Pirellulaceae bacterium]